MLITCWSAKGGSGVSTVAALLALHRTRRDGEALLVDLCGDQAAVLGLAPVESPGVTDWLAADDDVGADALDRLLVDAGDGLQLLPFGSGAEPAVGRGAALAAALADWGPTAIVDAGCLAAGDVDSPAAVCAAVSTHSFLVTRPCYLSLRRATAVSVSPSSVVLLHEAGRALSRADVESAVGVPVRAEIAVDAAVARAVDAGLLRCRLPRGLDRVVAGAA